MSNGAVKVGMRSFVLIMTLLAVVAACGPSPQSTDTPTGTPPAVVGAFDPAGAFAQGAALDGQTVTITGFFLADGSLAQLCSAVLESYPPQCGGPAITVVGEAPADELAKLTKPTEPGMANVSWGTAEVTGTYAGPGSGVQPTITISSFRVIPGE